MRVLAAKSASVTGSPRLCASPPWACWEKRRTKAAASRASRARHRASCERSTGLLTLAIPSSGRERMAHARRACKSVQPPEVGTMTLGLK